MCLPLANEGVGLGPSSSSGPVASRPPLAGRLLRRPRGDSFHQGVSCAGIPRMMARWQHFRKLVFSVWAASVCSGCLRFSASPLSRE